MWKVRWTAVVRKISVVSTTDEAAALLTALAQTERPRVLAFVNAHALNSCAENAAFFEALVNADVLLRDGVGMAALFKAAGRPPGLNMNGTDFIPRILAAFRGRAVALWGTEKPFVTRAAIRSEHEFGVHVVSCDNGFRTLDHYLRLARDVAPELIVLGMGMPKQEQLAQALRAQSPSGQLIVCGGAILDFLGGKIGRAPRIFRRLRLEWLYRLAREPQRLFRRYVIGNPTFLLKVLLWKRANR